MNKRFGLGVLMILFGVLWLLGNMNIIGDELFLMFVSLGFFAAYVLTGTSERKGILGFLIPACITLMIGAYAALEENINLGNVEGTLFFVFLGTAFWMVYFIHTKGLRGGSSGERKWPAITGTAIYAFGVVVFLIEVLEWRFVATFFNQFWPVILIGAGVIMLTVELLRRRER